MPNIQGQSSGKKSLDINRQSIDLDEIANNQREELDQLVDVLRQTKNQRNGKRNKFYMSFPTTNPNKKHQTRTHNDEEDDGKVEKQVQQLPTLEVQESFGSDDQLQNQDLGELGLVFRRKILVKSP